jgi:hypothetical protein
LEEGETGIYHPLNSVRGVLTLHWLHSVRQGPCNIPIRDSRLTQAEFLAEFATSGPVVVRCHLTLDTYLPLDICLPLDNCHLPAT